jgi:hypothetical protein
VVTDVDAILSEVAEAEAAGLKAEELTALRGQVGTSDISGLGMVYSVPDPDKASWIAAWRLDVGLDGIERGSPVKLTRQALGMYLSKRRERDGGRLFTLKMPEHMAPPRAFKCFVGDGACNGRYDTKMRLLDHIYAAHPKEAVHLEAELKTIRQSAMGENSLLQEIVKGIANTPDQAHVAIPASVREEYDAALPELNTSENVTETLSVVAKCDQCAWPAGSAKWANTPPSQQALKMHIFAKHKNEVE